ncbi:augmin subunit 5-like protein [Tanacetum coccineum]
MQNTTTIQPEAIITWLQTEMNYRPYNKTSSTPSHDSLRRICRGNMIPVLHFLLSRVKSEKTVSDIRRNILVHGGVAKSVENYKGRRRRKNVGESEDREKVEKERDVAQKEVEKLRRIVRRKRKELQGIMCEVSREECDRKRMLDQRSNSRHKQVMLEAYDAQCDDVVRIFSQYHKRLCEYVDRVKDAQRLETDSSMEVVTSIEMNKERDISKACESLAVLMVDKIHKLFPAYEGSGIHMNPKLETVKLGIDVDGDVPNEVRDVILDCLKSPRQFLVAVTIYTQKLKSLIAKEIQNIDVTADAETLRYKYENNKLMDASPDLSSPLQLKLYGNGNIGHDASKGTRYHLFERQKAHVQKFVATEDQLNKAAEARSACQKLLKHLSRSSGVGFFGGTLQNISGLRQLELDVWAMEREAAAIKASLTTLTYEVQRLSMLCEERRGAEESLKKKLKQIEEFDARRLELKSICDGLMKANTDAAAFWSQQPLAAREHSSNTIIPACRTLVNVVHSVKDLIHEEVSVFSRSPDNSLYMLPSTPQALLESVDPNGSTGPEAVAAAENNATLLTARAASGDPSAISSIGRVSSALQYPADSEASLASVLESMEFCLKLRGSEAFVLEELSKALNLVHTRRDLVESGRSLLNHAYDSQKDYKMSTGCCLDLASEQEEIIRSKWLPELKNGIASAQKSLDECKYVKSLLDEWWEQPASTLVDWETVDGQTVAAWINHMKQLLTDVYFKNAVMGLAELSVDPKSNVEQHALVGVECGGVGKPRFHEEVTTNEKGEFRIKLPFEPNKQVNEIKGCSVKLISSNMLDCPVAATAASSSVWLKVKTPENHIFSAGSFTFQPLEQPKRCQIESHENSNDEYDASTTPESHGNSNDVFGALTPFPSPVVKQTAIELDDVADINDFGFPYDQFLPPPLVPSFPFQPPPNSMFTPNFQTPPDSTFTPNFQTPPSATFTPNFQTPPGSMFTPNFQTPPGSIFTPNFQPPPDSMFDLDFKPPPDTMFNPVPVQPPPDSIFNPFQLSPPTLIPQPLTPPPPSFFPSFPFPPLEPQPIVIQSTPPPSIPPPSPPPPPTTPPGIMPPFPPFPFQPSPGNKPGTGQAALSAYLEKTSSP